MNGTLIVFEGIDGSGKATQSELLEKQLKSEGKEVLHLSFPEYESESSIFVRMYLSGEFGNDIYDVNPYASSLFFALDRFASFRRKWKTFYESGGVVIADRYTTSNMVHQMTKYSTELERQTFLDWLEDMEYVKLGLPRPDAVLLLNMPVDISEELVKKRAAEGGSMDIHEKNIDYLHKCCDAYQMLSARYGWIPVSCAKEGRLLSPQFIAEEVRFCLQGLGLK